MKNVTRKPISIPVLLVLFLIFGPFSALFAQTSWKGTLSTDWFNASNWTSGVPSSTTDAIIGDRSITNYPSINVLPASCKSITIGGAYTGNLTVNANLTVS